MLDPAGSLRLLDNSLSQVVHGHLQRCMGVEKAERNILGRWAQNQPDTYVQLQRTLVQKLQLLVVSVIRSRDDICSVLGEGKHCKKLKHSWRSEDWSTNPSRSSSARSTSQVFRSIPSSRTRRPSHCRQTSNHWKKVWFSWAPCKLKKWTCR